VFELSDGAAVTIRCEPVLDGGVILGALLRLRPVPAAGPSSRRDWVKRPFGWESLTATERSVTELVALGLTNPQVAERLLVSRYTVDFHLRSVFRKLEVRSRVDLTRLSIEHERAPRDDS
jgi:DNA-binding CsgD family transcriptional regulator